MLVSWEQGGGRAGIRAPVFGTPPHKPGRLRFSSALMKLQRFLLRKEKPAPHLRLVRHGAPANGFWGHPGKKTMFSAQPSGSAAPPPLREEGVGFSVGGPDSTLPGCWLLNPRTGI